jgi:cytochrome b involved in lipid metabolism
MPRLFQLSTVGFWLLVLAFWTAAVWMPADQPHSASNAAERSYSLEEVARHATPADCWMAIAGVVYDLTAYLPQHPSEPGVVTSWCGKEATEAYRTKTKGRPHSPYADGLLPKYRIGPLSGK